MSRFEDKNEKNVKFKGIKKKGKEYKKKNKIKIKLKGGIKKNIKEDKIKLNIGGVKRKIYR